MKTNKPIKQQKQTEVKIKIVITSSDLSWSCPFLKTFIKSGIELGYTVEIIRHVTNFQNNKQLKPQNKM